MTIALVYLVIINFITFYMMGYDKRQAKKGKHRVPEKRLFLFAAIGGSLGGWLGMRKWRHKTQHMSFVIGFPLLFVLNVAIIYFIIRMTTKW